MLSLVASLYRGTSLAKRPLCRGDSIVTATERRRFTGLLLLRHFAHAALARGLFRADGRPQFGY